MELGSVVLIPYSQYIALWFLIFGVLSFIYGLYAMKIRKERPREEDLAIAGIAWGLVMIAAGLLFF